MNENQNVDIDREQDNGQITYANEVISTIVSVATTEVVASPPLRATAACWARASCRAACAWI